jgi:hypothetical protein
LEDGFNIVLFVNSRTASTELGTQYVSSSIGRLFTPAEDETETVPFCMDGVCLETMSAHVFGADAWDGVESTWSHASKGVSIAYYGLTVTTVINKTLDIKGGHTGNLHIFALLHSESEPFPSK